MNPEFKNIDDSSVELARTISKIRTYIDLMGTIARFQKTQNSFWDLVFDSLYDHVVIDSFKLIDSKNLSLFSLIKLIKGIRQGDVDELKKDSSEIKSLIDKDNFLLIKHRHCQKAHISNKKSENLPRFADLSMVEELLDLCESKLKKYNKWLKGENYSIDFKSIYAGGHKEILNYVTQIINQ